MNDIINKFLLAGDKFIPEMHLKQPGFTYSACGPFTKNKQRIQKFMETGGINYIYRNELDKACFQYNMAYNFKDLKRRTFPDKVLRDKAYNTANNLSRHNGYERALATLVYLFFDKERKGAGIKNEIKENQQVANEHHKPIIRRFKKRKEYSSYMDNTWSVDLADMQLTSKYNKGIRYLLCAIDLLSKYALIKKE